MEQILSDFTGICIIIILLKNKQNNNYKTTYEAEQNLICIIYFTKYVAKM